MNEREQQVLRLREQGFSYKEIANRLNMDKSLVAYYCRKGQNLNYANKEKQQLEYEQIVCENVKIATSLSNLCKLMNKRATNNNLLHFQRIIDKHQLDTTHFSSITNNNSKRHKITFEERFSLREDKITNTNSLKNELLKLNIKEHKCELCGNSEWNNKPIPLQVHHINGNRFDNRIENLQLLCPNCHAQTDNFAGKNVRNKELKLYICVCCGKQFHRGNGSSKFSTQYCSAECRDKMNGRRNQYIRTTFTEERIERPTREQLIEDFKELGSFIQVGKKYNVTDNAVRKWYKKVGLSDKSSIMRKMFL